MEFENNDVKYVITTKDLINNDDYTKNILSKVFLYNDECGICYEGFDANELGFAVYLNCACKLGYHTQCITQAFDHNKSCPQCRKSNPVIVPFKGNIQDLGEYENFYDKANEHLNLTTDKLRFIHNWFAPVKDKAGSLRKSCLVNPFDYLSYTTHEKEFKESGLYRDLDDLHINPVDATSFEVGQQTMRNQEEFMEEFNKITNGFFQKDNSWSWDNIAICGGMVGKLLSHGTKYYPESSDFDMYVYGKDARDREDVVRRIVKFFGTYNAWFICKHAVIDVFIPGFPRNFQIIAGNFCNIDDILYSFDLSHIQAAISNLSAIYVTPEFLASQKYQITQIDESKFTMKRLLKIVGTGMMLASKRNVGDVAMFIKQRREGHYAPTKEEDPEKVITNFCDVYGISMDQITRDPAKCIHLIKIDQNIKNGTVYSDNVFLMDPQRFGGFDKLIIKQTAFNKAYLFRFEYPCLPRFIMEVRRMKLHDVTGYADTSGKQLKLDTTIMDVEDKNNIDGFCKKLKEHMLEYVKDQPWIKLKTFINKSTFQFNNYKSGTKVYQNNKLIDNQYFVNRGMKGQIVDAVIVLNGISCGYEATMGTLEFAFQEIRYSLAN